MIKAMEIDENLERPSPNAILPALTLWRRKKDSFFIFLTKASYQDEERKRVLKIDQSKVCSKAFFYMVFVLKIKIQNQYTILQGVNIMIFMDFYNP